MFVKLKQTIYFKYPRICCCRIQRCSKTSRLTTFYILSIVICLLSSQNLHIEEDNQSSSLSHPPSSQTVIICYVTSGYQSTLQLSVLVVQFHVGGSWLSHVFTIFRYTITLYNSLNMMDTFAISLMDSFNLISSWQYIIYIWFITSKFYRPLNEKIDKW